MPTQIHISVPRMLIGTLVLNTVIAVALTALSPHGWIDNLVISQCVGLLTYAVIDLPRRVLWPAGAPPLVPMAVLVLAAALFGWFGGGTLAGLLLGRQLHSANLMSNTTLGFLSLTVAAGFGGTYHFWTRERMAHVERTAAEARLKLLQAQIEPHFLFNTLANLQALIAIDPQRAQSMLSHLDGYLRATLTAARSDRGTLTDEFSLLRAYLEIIAIRMGPRLAFVLDLPAALAPATVPPMLLQPLVENAIKHGLEPKIDGGRLLVAARSDGKHLLLTVEDTGLGLADGAATAGTGVGLAHVRERLAAAYGDRASMHIASGNAGGAVVTLRLPLQTGT